MRRLATILLALCLLVALAAAAAAAPARRRGRMFVTKARWAQRGSRIIARRRDDQGRPFEEWESWGVRIRRRLTTASLAIDRPITNGREFDVRAGVRLRWQTTDNLAPFEETAGELKHLAEWGASITSCVLATAPAADWSVRHRLELPAGSTLAYQPPLTQAEKDEGCVRPAAVVGSYAVFGPAGCKVAHTPRPCAVDANGKRVWGTITINPTTVPGTGFVASVVQFKLADLVGLVYPITLYGEGYGARIQKGGGNYRRDGDISFRLFDVLVGERSWLGWGNTKDIADTLGILTVPLVDYGICSAEDIIDFVRAGFISVVAQEEGTPILAEGIVARTDPYLFDGQGRRVVWKIKTKEF